MPTKTFCSKIKKYINPTPDECAQLNLYEIFKPIYYTLSLIGMFPYSVSYNLNKNTFKIIVNSIYRNTLCVASTIITLYAFYVAHIQNLYTTSEISSMTDAFMTQLNYILEISALIVFSTIAYICAFMNRYKYVEILNSVSSHWAPVRSASQDKSFGRLRYQVNVTVMGTLLFAFVLQLAVNSTRVDSVWKILLVTFSFIAPQVIQMITLAFHFVLVLMVVAILIDVNQQLFVLTRQKMVVDDLFIGGRQADLSLSRLEAAYVKAFEVKRHINEAFQAPILMTTIQCFHSIVSESFILYHGLVGNTHSTHSIANCSIWISYQLLKIYSLAYSGNMLKEEANKIGQALHTIPIEIQDLRTLLEIQHFSSLMSHQKFVLTVYGYFPLDATLMSTMVATVTMYLIILVQFDRNSRGE